MLRTSTSRDDADDYGCITTTARAIVRRDVHLAAPDKRQLCVGSVCSCFIAAALSVEFDLIRDARKSSPS